MDEVKITKQDYRDILDWATDYYKNKHVQDPNYHMCQAYLNAIVNWAASRNYQIVNGKILPHEKSNQTQSE